MVRLTDRPDMTLDVYRGRKTTIQQQQVRLQYWAASLCNQLLPEFSSNQIETLHRCYKHIEDVHVTFSRQESNF